MSRRLSSRCYSAVVGLARRLHLDKETLLSVFKADDGPESFYLTWKIPKESGGYRIIYDPQGPLRTIQEAIKRELLPKLYTSEVAHGCVERRSIVTNAECHAKSKSMIGMDLSDAFGSASLTYRIHWDPYFRSRLSDLFGLRKVELAILVQLVDVDNGREVRYRSLPQGAITSPDIFNYYCSGLDEELLKLANNVGGVVTRYVDNIFFSMPSNCVDKKICNAIYRNIREAGFEENFGKRYFINNGNRNGVPLRMLGLNIIDGDLYLPPKTIDLYRRLLYQAGLNNDHETYSWIKGVVTQIYAGWPSRLDGIYHKGQVKAGHRTKQWIVI